MVELFFEPNAITGFKIVKAEIAPALLRKDLRCIFDMRLSLYNKVLHIDIEFLLSILIN